MPRPLPRVVISGLRGGSGKTTLSLGIIQALRDRGTKVAPFKKGPDYIDPFWHTEAAGTTCRNLDPYLMGRDQVRASFAHFTRGFAAAVVEGNRGLYDGMDAAGSQSTAELAKWLQAPVVLVLDCTMTGRTVAALALGCRRFDAELDLAGVILNPVGNPRQEKVIRRALEESVGLPVLGAIPRLELNLPERHMGLVPPQEHRRVAQALHQAARSVAAHVDMEALWRIMSAAPALEDGEPPRGLLPGEPPPARTVRIGVVRDAAFGFYYPENLEALANFGAELVFCSALEDPELPPVDALYLGGGFPETHARRLSGNRGFRDSLRRAAARGLPVYAECGGMMYLGGELVVEGRGHAMAGVLPLDFIMHTRPQGHGYTRCRVEGANPFLPRGCEFRAHEFHYSRPRPHAGYQPRFAYRVLRGKGILADGGGLVQGNVLATYHHVHCLGLPQWAPALVAAASGHRSEDA